MAKIESVKVPDNSEYNLKDAVSGYASKVTSATNGHLAGLNASGDLTDSGVASADVVTKVSGGTTNNLVKLDSNGKIADSGILATDVVTKVTGGTTDDLVKLDSNGKIADAGKKVSDLAEKDDISSLIETGATASQQITAGTYFYLNGNLVRAKTTIGQGNPFTENTNYESVTVGGELININTTISMLSKSDSYSSGTHDANDFEPYSVYMATGSSTTHLPSTSDTWLVMTFGYDATNKFQLCVRKGANAAFIRYCMSGTWRSWKVISDWT